jgi:hypothetical protein
VSLDEGLARTVEWHQSLRQQPSTRRASRVAIIASKAAAAI